MGAAWFAGRVSGLPVALGVRAAVTLGTPSAWVDAGSEGSDGSASTSATERGDTSASRDAKTGAEEPTSGSGIRNRRDRRAHRCALPSSLAWAARLPVHRGWPCRSSPWRDICGSRPYVGTA